MRRQAERDDELSLLALIAASLGADTEDYDPPFRVWRDWMDELRAAAPVTPGERLLRVLEAAEATGGEVS
jgi:hypothetical protein